MLARAYNEAAWSIFGRGRRAAPPPIERVKDALNDLKDDVLEWAGFEIGDDWASTLQAVGVEFALRCLDLLTEGRFVSVCSEGGLIDRVLISDDLDQAIKAIRGTIGGSFDPGSDDARIFKMVPGEAELEQVYSYKPEEDK